MKGYVVRNGGQYYAVIYEGLPGASTLAPPRGPIEPRRRRFPTGSRSRSLIRS